MKKILNRIAFLLLYTSIFIITFSNWIYSESSNQESKFFSIEFLDFDMKDAEKKNKIELAELAISEADSLVEINPKLAIQKYEDIKKNYGNIIYDDLNEETYNQLIDGKISVVHCIQEKGKRYRFKNELDINTFITNLKKEDLKKKFSCGVNITYCNSCDSGFYAKPEIVQQNFELIQKKFSTFKDAKLHKEKKSYFYLNHKLPELVDLRFDFLDDGLAFILIGICTSDPEIYENLNK